MNFLAYTLYRIDEYLNTLDEKYKNLLCYENLIIIILFIYTYNFLNIFRIYQSWRIDRRDKREKIWWKAMTRELWKKLSNSLKGREIKNKGDVAGNVSSSLNC